MLRRTSVWFRPFAAAVAAFCLAAWPLTAMALILGGVGNEPVRDPGWPAGAAAIFNHKGRVAWWEGPPFGGGQWHAECRGDAAALSAVLADFAKLDVKSRRVVLHDGVGRSFWLNPNRAPEKAADARIDWIFMVWVPGNFDRLRKLPADLNPTDKAGNDPPSQIDVYTGELKWKDVKVPAGIEVLDRRLEAHGFSADDGAVLEGTVVDLVDKKPLSARVRLELVQPQPAPTGGYRYSKTAEATADAAGRWVIKKAPKGWHRVVVEAEGYVPRVAGYAQFDGQPGWHEYPTGLAKPADVSGRVVDAEGKPLADVNVRLGDVTAEGEGRYESTAEFSTKTDAEGRFRHTLPKGSASVWIHKSGYCRPGLGLAIKSPQADIALAMQKSAQVTITVDFGLVASPNSYIVHMSPEGGEMVGKWGGSGNIDANHQITYRDVPPGRYVIYGRPNPGSDKEQTEKVTVELKGGEAQEVKLLAK